MAEKIYCGNARIFTTQYGDLLKCSMHKDDINKVVKWMKENNSDWFNFTVKEKQNKQEGKPTHYLELDEWKPQAQPTPPPPPEQVADPNDDLPF